MKTQLDRLCLDVKEGNKLATLKEIMAHLKPQVVATGIYIAAGDVLTGYKVTTFDVASGILVKRTDVLAMACYPPFDLRYFASEWKSRTPESEEMFQAVQGILDALYAEVK